MTEIYKTKTAYNSYAEINIPGSKSITNRALILASLSENPVIIKNPLFSDDTVYMIEGLKTLGNNIEISSDKKTIKVRGNKTREFGNQKIFVGNAGTVMRFLVSYIASGKGEIIIEGSPRMNERPIGELVNSMRELGAEIKYLQKEGYPPLKISAKGISKTSVHVSGKNSSQYLSSVLLSAPYFEKGLDIIVSSNIISKPYVNMTLKMIEQFGGKAELTSTGYKILPQKYNNLTEYSVEGDMSSASYFLAAALVTKSKIKINNFFAESIQGDYKLLDILKKHGLKVIEQKKDYIIAEGTENYSGFNLNLNDTPDIVPTLAVTALFADSPTVIKDVESLRVKECDRIFALCTEIKKLNGNIIEYQDGFKIIPKPFSEYKGCNIATYDDHRIAMSFAVAGLKISGINILNPKCVSKTFPQFFDEFEKIYLGGVHE